MNFLNYYFEALFGTFFSNMKIILGWREYDVTKFIPVTHSFYFSNDFMNFLT